jgi:hypothetical protein
VKTEKGTPCKKAGSPISLERFAYLQLFALRKKETPSLTAAEFQIELRKSMMGVDTEARKHGHKSSIAGKE